MAQRLKTDWILFSTIVAMVGFGLIMIYSASSVIAELNPRINFSFYYASHQLFWAVFSFAALMYFKRRDYRLLQSPAWAFGSLGVVLFLQMLVFFFDSKTHRWFRLQGIGTLQPSEFAKPALIIFFAYFVSREARGDQHQTHDSGGIARLVGIGGCRRPRRLRNGDRADRTRRSGLLCRGIGAQVSRGSAGLWTHLLSRIRDIEALPNGARHRIL